jgi:hypothetical protein
VLVPIAGSGLLQTLEQSLGVGRHTQQVRRLREREYSSAETSTAFPRREVISIATRSLFTWDGLGQVMNSGSRRGPQ